MPKETFIFLCLAKRISSALKTFICVFDRYNSVTIANWISKKMSQRYLNEVEMELILWAEMFITSKNLKLNLSSHILFWIRKGNVPLLEHDIFIKDE